MAYTIQNGSPVYPGNVFYKKIILTEDVAVSWPFSFTTGTVVGRTNNVYSDQDGWSIILPDATLATLGQDILLNNVSVYNFLLYAHDGTTLLATVESGDVIYLYLYENTLSDALPVPSNGLWITIPFGGGTNAITALTAHSTDGSIIISNGSITPPGGTINFKLPTSLSNLNAANTTGFPVITGTAPLTWDTRTITAGNNIEISNGSGVVSNPVVSLSDEVTGLTSLGVGEFTFSGNILSAEEDVNLLVTTQGEGILTVNAVEIDEDGNTTIPGNLTVNGTFFNPLTPRAWCLFTDTLTGADDSTIEIINGTNIDSITGGGGKYELTIADGVMDSDSYGVMITVGTAITDGDLPYVAHGFSVYQAQTMTKCSIAVVDASGQYITQALSGITVQILSSNDPS